MIKELVTDEKILSTPCEPATTDDAELAQDLVDTMGSMDNAICLAANQIGVTKSMFAYLDEDGQPHIMCNPVMKRGLYPFKTTETCLTRDDETKINRFGKIRVDYEEIVDGQLVKKRGEFTDYTAQAIQHMIDHCKGKLV